MASKKLYKNVDEIASILQQMEEEEERNIIDHAGQVSFYIAPPDPNFDTDEDSADEDSPGTWNNLNRHQLFSEAELVFENDNGEDILRVSSQDGPNEISVEPHLESLQANRIETPLTLPQRFQPTTPRSRRSNLFQSGASLEPSNQQAVSPTPTVQSGRKILRRSFGKNKPNYEWKKGDLLENDIRRSLYSPTTYFMPNHTQRPLRPLECFQFFFNDKFLEQIVKYSVTYAVSKGKVSFQFSVDELKAFIGILIITGYVITPRRRMYWEESKDTYNSAISDTMRRNRFEEIMRFIHLSDTSHFDQNDRIWKIRPYVDHLKTVFREYAVWENSSSVDEAMIPYFGRHGLKQCIRGKPIRFGYKAWCHNLRLGYLIDFDIYQGAKGKPNEFKEQFGVGRGVLLQFANSLPKDQTGEFVPHQLFADNYFTSLKVVEACTSIRIGITGTIRKDRTGGCPLKEVSRMKKEERGSFDCCYEKKSNAVFLCRWHDNSVVTVISNCQTSSPVGSCSRYSAVEKKKVPVKLPNVIQLYNDNKGGTDLMDQNVSTYRIGVRSKKWWWPLFIWGMDVALQNAWQLHRLSTRSIGEPSVDFLEFKRSVAKELTERFKNPKKRSGFSTSLITSRVEKGTRFEGIGHYLVTKEKRTRCAMCKSTTSKKCSKCDVALHEKCFAAFHVAI